MEDPALNRRIDETRELSTRWGQFRDFLNMATKGEKVTPEAESKFLELKTRIAMLHDGFMHSLKHDHKVGQQVLGIISACIMLRRVPLMSGAELQKLELDWNEAYLLITETIANLEEERQRLASINMRAYKLQQAKQIFTARVHNVLVSPLFRLFFFLFVVAFVLWGVPALGIYNWLDLREHVPFTKGPINKGIEWWRGHVNSEFPYDTLAEVPVDAAYVLDGAQAQGDIPASLNPDFVVNQLFNLGFKKGADFDKARSLLGGKIDFQREVQLNTRTNRKMIGFYFLLKDTKEAREFIELRQANLTSLPPEERQKIQRTAKFGRKANFIAIVITEDEAFRTDYLGKKYLLTPEQLME